MTTIEEIQQVLGETEKRLSEIIGRRVFITMIKNESQSEENFYPITTTVCDACNVPTDVIFTKTRKRDIVEARFLTMWYLYGMCNANKSEIARYLRVDHTSVIHGLKTVRDRIRTNDFLTTKLMTLIDKSLSKYS